MNQIAKKIDGEPVSTQTDEQTKSESAMQKFRRENFRVDYYPIPEAVSAIERLRQSKPGVCTRELIDILVMEGIKTFFPEIVEKVSG